MIKAVNVLSIIRFKCRCVSSCFKFAFVILTLTNFNVHSCIRLTTSVNIYVTRNHDNVTRTSLLDDSVPKCSFMIMWRSSKRLIINCVQFVIRCGRNNFDADDLDDISDYDVLDVPSNIAIVTPVAVVLWQVHFFKKFTLINEKSFYFNVK